MTSKLVQCEKAGECEDDCRFPPWNDGGSSHNQPHEHTRLCDATCSRWPGAPVCVAVPEEEGER